MTIRSLIFNPITATLLLLIGLGIIWSLRQTAINTRQTNQAVEEMRQEVEALEKFRDEQAQKAQTSATASTKEKIIRDQLLQQKPGETIVQLPALPSSVPTPSTPTPTVRPLQLWRDKLLLR